MLYISGYKYIYIQTICPFHFQLHTCQISILSQPHFIVITLVKDVLFWFLCFLNESIFDSDLQELEYWGLTELDIEPCCWGQYSKFKDHKETLAALDDNFTSQIDVETTAWDNDKPSSLSRFKHNMWLFLEEPGSSRLAKVNKSVFPWTVYSIKQPCYLVSARNYSFPIFS